MDRLLNISNTDGYPLCAETLELLHNNVQLLETVLNGLNLPQYTVVRFPYGNFAYVQNDPSTSGRGEILEIATGANLANGLITHYKITYTNHDIEYSNNTTYHDVYQDRRLNLYDFNNNSVLPNYTHVLGVWNFEELLEKSMWRTLEFYRYVIGSNNSTSLSCASPSFTPILIAKYNGSTLRIRVCLDVINLSISANSELGLSFLWPDNPYVADCLPLRACFNGNNNSINHGVDASVVKGTINGNTVAVLKISTGQLYNDGDVTTFTGRISVNGVISLDS